MREKIEGMIIEILQDLNDDIESEALENPTKETKIFGEGGALDSLALVSLITEIEERVHDEFDKSIVLADEKTMSKRQSPFATVESLSEFVEFVMTETAEA